MTRLASRAPLRTRLITWAAAAAVALGWVVATPDAARADVAGNTALPTVQIDGVAWSQVVVGNRVYVAGSFATARPAGAAPGTNLTPRANLLAYDITTGALIQSWAPSLNAQATAIAASQDGSRIFVGGDFTSVNGVNRYRVAALDAQTGALITSFTAKTDSRVRALAVSGNTLYAGGSFSSANNVARNRVAAFSTTDGALLTWAPTVNATVTALAVAPRGANTQIVIGGWFTAINGQSNVGMGSVDSVTGASYSWPANQVIRNGGNSGLAISALISDGNQVYGTGYNYVGYLTGRLEGSFAADLNGNVRWVAGCHGDHYSAFPMAGALYQVGHAHDCSYIGGFGETFPRSWRRALSFTLDATTWNFSGDFTGQRAPSLLGWQPQMSAGTYTGQGQGGWHVTGDSRYVVVGGEFPSVNGPGQQGLVRFAIGTPQGPATFATDTFSRTVNGSWGTADLGGDWFGGSSATSVAGGAGRVQVNAGQTVSLRLSQTVRANADLSATFWTEAMPTGGGLYQSFLARHLSAGSYRAEVRITSAGQVTVRPVRVLNGVESALTSATPVTGLTYSAGTRLAVRVQASGTNPTTVRAKVWVAGQAEPDTWTVSATDSSAALQTTGSVGVSSYQSASAVSPLVIRVDDLSATS